MSIERQAIADIESQLMHIYKPSSFAELAIMGGLVQYCEDRDSTWGPVNDDQYIWVRADFKDPLYTHQRYVTRIVSDVVRTNYLLTFESTSYFRNRRKLAYFHCILDVAGPNDMCAEIEVIPSIGRRLYEYTLEPENSIFTNSEGENVSQELNSTLYHDPQLAIDLTRELIAKSQLLIKSSK